MVFLVKKKINGNNYLYLQHKARINGKSKVVWQLYLGPEKKLQQITENFSIHLENHEPEVHDFGLPILLFLIAKRLKLVEIIDQFVTKRVQGLSVGEYILISALNRCIKPTSKSKIKKWFNGTYLKSKLPLIETYLDSNAYVNHYAYLSDEIIKKIELELNKVLIKEFNIDMKDIYYDPTNYYTFINPKQQELPRHGHSKEGRRSLNLINLSLFCNAEGIPFMHQTYAGNIQDATQFKTEFPKFIQRVNSLSLEESTLTLVFDKGNISEEVFEEIEKSNVNFICSIRPSTQKDLHGIKGEEFELFTLPNGKEVGLKKFNRELYTTRYPLIVSYNPLRNKWNRSVKLVKVEEKVQSVKDFFETRWNKNKWRDKENVKAKIIKIIKNKEYLDYIDFEVTGDYGNLDYSIMIKSDIFQEHLDSLGKSYFMTNRSELTPKEVVWAYRQQYTVENAFRYLKRSDYFQLRPMYHSKDTSIRGHVFSTVLSLLLTSLLHREVRMKFPEMSLIEMLDNLSEIEVVSVELKNRTINKIKKLSSDAKKLSDYFNLKQYL